MAHPALHSPPVSAPRAARRAALSAVAAWLASALAAVSLPAAALEVARGKVVLTLRGRISKPNQGAVAEFDMEMLEALPQHSITQTTPWFPGPRKFTGPLLRDVLAAAGANGRSLEAIAINDYKVSIPVEDVHEHEVILARLLDDQPMPVRSKGPLFIVYPFGSDAKLRSSIYYSRSAWQLKALEVRP